MLADPDSFEEWDAGIRTSNPLGFAEPSGSYDSKIAKTVARTGEQESLVTGRLTISGHALAVAVCDFGFLGRQHGLRLRREAGPGGRARAEERHAGPDRQRLRRRPHARGALLPDADGQDDRRACAVSARRGCRTSRLLTDPCYGGVTASYAMVADVILAEPGALIGFAGPRVIEQVIKQKLPEGFQTAEFLLEHGMIDRIVDRAELRDHARPALGHYSRIRAADPA